MDVGILGGTGPAGRALGVRLAGSGCSVMLGSRAPDRGAAAAAELRQAWPDRQLALGGGSNGEAASAALVVLATPYEAATATVKAVRALLDGKVLISMANALQRTTSGFEALIPSRGSVAASIQAAAPATLVAGAFHHLPARRLGDLDTPLDADVLICSDHRQALEATEMLVERIDGVRAVRAGGLQSAGAIEALTAVLINVNVAYRTEAALRITGLRTRE